MTRKQSYLTIALLLLSGLAIQFEQLSKFPAYIHAWAQADRLALAHGFVHNNLNFFKPETYVMNHQFPDNWQSASATSVTAVEFPIHDFIPAVFMKLTGSTSPFIFRMYIFLYSVLGLYFLFRLAYMLTNNVFKSALTVVFAATSPLFMYYQAGFLPSIPSFANAVAGLYFYLAYRNNNNTKIWLWSILFLTLATLSRSTFAILFASVLCIELYRVFKKETTLKEKVIPVLAGILTIILYTLYNNYLRATYGSIFLSSLMPAKDFSDAMAILTYVVQNWLTHYFSIIHYILLAILISTVIIIKIKFKTQYIKSIPALKQLILLSVVGYLLFSVAMMQQLQYHDYYFIDTFFLPSLLVFIYLLHKIPFVQMQFENVLYTLFVACVSIPLIIIAAQTQDIRNSTGPWDRTTATIGNFNGASAFLDKLAIPKNAKMLVIDAYAPNIPFLQMQRKGFVVMTTSKENIENALHWPYDYIVMQNEFFISDIYNNYPEILNKLELVGDNGKIMICKKRSQTSNQSLFGFLGLENKQPKYNLSVNFDSEVAAIWNNVQLSTTQKLSGIHSCITTPDYLYGLTYKTKDIDLLRKGSVMLHVGAGVFNDSTLRSCDLVVTLQDGASNTYYKTYPLQDMLKQTKTWQQVDLIFQLPRVSKSEAELAIYFMNQGKNTFYVDDFTIRFY